MPPPLLAAVLILVACEAPGGETETLSSQRRESTPARLVVVGDTQRTSLAERLIGREQNDHERARVLEYIAEERAPILIHLGDMVFDASDAAEWKRFDELVRPIRDTGTTILGVLGNHEYWGGSESGIVHVEERGRRSTEKVRVRMPLAVVDALVGDDAGELDLVAALKALGEYEGDPLVDIESDDSSVRVWIDSSEVGR